MGVTMVCSHQYVFVINWWLQEREKKKKKTFTCPSLIRIIKENIKGKAGQDVYFKQTRRGFLLCLILHLGNFTSSLPSKVAENSFTVARGYNSKTKACNLTYLQKKTYRENKVIQLDQLAWLFLDICEVGKDT